MIGFVPLAGQKNPILNQHKREKNCQIEALKLQSSVAVLRGFLVQLPVLKCTPKPASLY